MHPKYQNDIYMTNRVVSLVLSSTDISTNAGFVPYPYTDIIDNSVGTLSNCKTNIRWKNINLRQLLGDLYDNYEYFTIEVAQIMTLIMPFAQNSMTSGTFSRYRNLNVYLSGLDFVNSTYNQLNNCQKKYAHVGNLCTLFLSLNNTVSNSTFHPSSKYMYSVNDDYRSSKIIFHKTRQYVDINIWFGSMSETIDVPNVFPFDYTVFPHTTFKFNIKPVIL